MQWVSGLLKSGSRLGFGWFRGDKSLADEAGPFASAGLVVWAVLSIVALNYVVAALGELPLPGGAIFKILTFTLLLVSPIMLVPGPKRRWAAAAVVLALTFLGFSDLIYIRHFGNFIQVTSLLGVSATWDIRGSIIALIRAVDLWLIPFALAALLMTVFGPTGARRPKSAPYKRLVATLLLAAPGIGLLTYNATHWEGRKTRSHARMADYFGLYGAHLLDAMHVTIEWLARREATEEDVADVRQYLQSVQAPSPTDNVLTFGSASGKSVLVVQMEAVQSWVINQKIRGREVTPFLNQLAAEALFFPNILDQTGDSNTADAEYATLNSQHPMKQGAVVFRRSDNDFVALPRLLTDAGYSTLSAHPWHRGFWNRAVMHPRYGFERSMFRAELGGIRDQIGWGSSDKAVYETMVPILADMEQPFFAYIITLMSHHPYNFLRADQKVLDVGPLEGTMLGDYLHIMSAVDSAIEELFERLAAAELLDNTTVVMFGDHDARLQIPPSVINAGHTELGLTTETLQWLTTRDPRADFVPMFIRLPGEPTAARIETVGGHVDIAPTILHLLGIEAPEAFIGRALSTDTEHVVARLDGSAVAGGRMYLATGHAVGANGGCAKQPDWSPLPAKDCAELRDMGLRQLQASWKITDLNLANRFAAPSATPAQ